MEILHRELRLQATEADTMARTINASLSSDTPVDRAFGREILDHSHGAVDLSRANPLPLLFNHNTDEPIGSARNVRIDGGKLRATLHFADTARGGELFSLIRGGHITGVSIGYAIDQLERSTTPDTFIAKRWQLLEASIAPIPADHTVGIGRSISSEKKMEIQAKSDREIINELLAVGEQYKQHGGVELASRAIREGKDEAWLSNELMRAMSTNPSPASPLNEETQLGLTPTETRKYSLLRMIRSVVENDPRIAPFEYECNQQMRKKFHKEDARGFLVPPEVLKRGQRDLSAGIGSAGGYTVATDNLGSAFVDMLRNQSRVMELGATRMGGLRGNVTIPKQTGAATAYWLAEGTQITESQQTFGQISMTPKTVGAYTEVTRQLLLQSDPSAETLVINDLGKVVALAVDLAAINGTGASNQPLGLLNTAGIGSVSGTSLAYAGILEFQTDVGASNALTAGCSYFTTPAVAGLLAQRQRFTSTDSPLWEGNIVDGKVSGFKAASSNQVPTATMIFGDFSQVVIAEWGILEVLANPYADFKSGLVGIRAMYSVDIAIRNASAFSVATTIT